MSSISELKGPFIWNTEVKEDSLFNKAIHFSKGLIIPFVTSAVTSLFWKTYCRTLSTCENDSPSLPLLCGAILTYNIFKERKGVYKLYLIGKNYFNKNSKAFTKLAENEIRNELISKMGKRWLKNQSFTLEEGVRHLAKICLINNGTCDGEVLTFLHLINHSKAASLEDDEIQMSMKPIDFIKYQVRRELKVDVRNHRLLDLSFSILEKKEKTSEILFFGLDDPLLNECKTYDPYTAFEKYCIYEQLANVRAIDLVFMDIQKYAQENLHNNDHVLVGRITYLGEKEKIAHSISVQLNFNHYRYRDVLMFSFQTLEELLKNLYQHSNRYFDVYNKIEVRLWKLPYTN